MTAEPLYRAHVYYAPADGVSSRITSPTAPTYRIADAWLAHLLDTTDAVTGGGIERQVPGIGWVVADEPDAPVVVES